MPQMEPDFARINLFPQSVLEAWHILGWIFEKIPLESYIKLRFLIIHGILHIYGHEHDSDEDRQNMENEQLRLLKLAEKEFTAF